MQRRSLIAELLAGSPNAAERAQRLAAITAGMAPSEIQQLVDPTRARYPTPRTRPTR
jgi:hypothetical protein